MSQGKTLTQVVKAEKDKAQAAEAKANAVAAKEELEEGHALVRLIRPLVRPKLGSIGPGLVTLPFDEVPKSAKWIKPEKPPEGPKADEAKPASK